MIWNLERDGYKHVQGEKRSELRESRDGDSGFDFQIAGVERVLNGHRRAVNRICWHTTDWNVLISGSQDGTVKLWVLLSALTTDIYEGYLFSFDVEM